MADVDGGIIDLLPAEPILEDGVLGESFTVIDAADHRLLRGPAFSDLVIDRSRWPALIRGGYDRTTAARDPFR